MTVGGGQSDGETCLLKVYLKCSLKNVSTDTLSPDDDVEMKFKKMDFI